MGDLGDDFRAFKEFKRKRKADAYRKAKPEQRLSESGIAFSTHNNGMHLIVSSGGGTIDFWPTTGRWKTREGKEGWGVKELIAFINHNQA